MAVAERLLELKAPFPYFGGKARIAAEVWVRFGDVQNYVEPFAGSLAVLLGRPTEPRIETVNDADGLLCNFWRALQADPEAVAHHADWPVNECDLHARHSWLVARKDEYQTRLEGDPDWYDAKAAGWWVWGISCWIGSGWCSGKGPWHVVDGRLVNTGDAGQGVNRKLPHLGDAGQGVNRKRNAISAYLTTLSERIRNVRVCCGDWTRVCGPCVTFKHGTTAVFLDPPYAHSERAKDLYRVEMPVADAVREWAIANGDNPDMRIALCGYEGEHAMPPDWECLEWRAKGGYDSQGDGSNLNKHRERVWFSPACLRVARCVQASLFRHA